MGWLEAASDADLRCLEWGRLRDQAVAMLEVVSEYKGRYLALYHCAEAGGLTPYLSEQLDVRDCNRNGSGLQSSHFWDRIICLYPSPQDRIICL